MTERAFATLERFLHLEAVSGIVLLVAAAIALYEVARCRGGLES